MGQEIDGIDLEAEDSEGGCTEEPEGNILGAKSIARSFKSFSALDGINNSLARTFPSVNDLTGINNSLARTFPFVNNLTGINNSLAHTFPSVNKLTGINNSLAHTFPSVNKLTGINNSLARTFPSVNKLTGINNSLARTFPFVNNLTGINNSLVRTFPFVNNLTGINNSLVRTFPFINNLTGINNSLTRTFPFVNNLTGINNSLARTFPSVTIAANLRWALALSFPTVFIAADLRRSFSPSFPAVDILGDLNRRLALSLQFEETGWFPHSTFPVQIFDEVQDYAEIDEKILAYYRQNWIEVCNEIESELAGYLIDEKEKNVLRQALRAHENSLHYLVSPSLFTEIERAVRVHLNENKIGNLSVGNEMTNRLSEIPISAFPDRLVGYVGYGLFSHHLYKSIRTDDDRDYFSKRSMPNRHAVIHGLFDYEAEKSSLNSIFIACYVFQIITLIKIQEIKRVFDNSP